MAGITNLDCSAKKPRRAGKRQQKLIEPIAPIRMRENYTSRLVAKLGWRSKLRQRRHSARECFTNGLTNGLTSSIHQKKFKMTAGAATIFCLVLNSCLLLLSRVDSQNAVKPTVSLRAAEIALPEQQGANVIATRSSLDRQESTIQQDSSNVPPQELGFADATFGKMPNGAPEGTPVVNSRIGSIRDILRPEHARQVQQWLAALGYYPQTASGIWSTRSREALRAFKKDNGLSADDTWDDQTERASFDAAVKNQTFVGTWAADPSACSAASSEFFPTVIRLDGAQAGSSSCSFRRVNRASVGWNVAGSCSDRGESWNTRIHLVVFENRLTWTSQRGAHTYVRCGPPATLARRAP